MALNPTTGYAFAAAEKVTPAKLNQMVNDLTLECATSILLGRKTAGDGAVEELTPADVRTLLALVIGTNVQAYNANLTTFAGIAPSANVQSLLAAADYAALRTLLGLVIGTNVQAYNANLTTFAGIAPSANVQSLLAAADYAALRTLLGLVIGTNVQAYNANLTTFAGIAPSANVQSLLGAADYAAMRTQLGLFGSNLESTVTGNIQAGSSGTDLVYTSGPTVDLTAGSWLVWGSACVRTNDSLGEFWLGFRNTTDGSDFGQGANCKNYDLNIIHHLSCFAPVTVAATKTIRLKAFISGAHTLEIGSTNGISGAIRAVRLNS